MVMKRILGAAAFLALSAGYAAAVPAVVETDLNARSGPGTGYAVVATLPEGSTVEVVGCDGNWCQIDLGGQNAYASRRYLALSGGGASRVTVVPRYSPGYVYDPFYDPYYVPGYVYGPSIGIYTGPRWRHRHSHRHDWRRSGQWQGRGTGQWQGRSGGARASTAPQFQAPSRGTVGMGRAAAPARSGDRDSGSRGGGAPAAPSGLR